MGGWACHGYLFLQTTPELVGRLVQSLLGNRSGGISRRVAKSLVSDRLCGNRYSPPDFFYFPIDKLGGGVVFGDLLRDFHPMNKTHLLKFSHTGSKSRVSSWACFLVAIAYFVVIAPMNAAVTSSWAAWTSPGSFPYTSSVPYSYNTNAVGTLTMPDTTSVTVSLNGEVATLSLFGNLSPVDDRWSTYSAGTFTSSNVPSLPNNGDYIFSGGYGLASQTLTFSQTVSNIVLDIWSLGTASTPSTWTFNQPFTVLSQDPSQRAFVESGQSLTGYESSGTIEFLGTFTSLSWTVSNPEYGVGWNIGATSASVVPEPSTYALVGMGTLVLILAYRRKSV